jgi:hypothetical protein
MMVCTKKEAALAPSTNAINNVTATQQVKLRRSIRKRKIVFYGDSGKGSKAKKAKTTKTEGARNDMEETGAAPPLEPLNLENSDDLALGVTSLAKRGKKQKQVALVDHAVDEMEHIGDTPSQHSGKSTTVTSEAAEAAKTTHLIADVPRYEEPVKSEEASAATQIGTQTAPTVTDHPLIKVAPKLVSKQKTRRMKTMINGMAIDEDGEEMRQKKCVQSSLAAYW